ncbi:MAG: cysteine desulfurase [Candidatus Methanosuratus sp.]|nr:cysteine desulfurase [Candidatus Methanosuratincola sp.]
MLNVEAVRKDFPFISPGRVYLDSASTSLTPEPVLAKMLEYYRDYRANVGRGIYVASRRATDEFEAAREKLARLINAKPGEIIFVRNTSEAMNLVASGLDLRPGDKVVTTIQEHHSNYIVWLREKARKRIDLRVVGADAFGDLNITEIQDEIERGAKLVSMTHVSNVLGVRNPVEEIGKACRKNGVLLLVDGAQSVPHMRIDVKRIGCDFLAFSGHKMCGPTGAGALYIREDLQGDLEPLCIGGGSIEDVGVDYYALRSGPYRFEAGTPAIAEVIGMGAAAEYLMGIGMENIEAHEAELTREMLEAIKVNHKIKVYGSLDAKRRNGIISFNLEGMDPHDVALALDRAAGIMVRSGHHCALPLMKEALKIGTGSVRASVYLYNTKPEVRAFVETLSKISESGTSGTQ